MYRVEKEFRFEAAHCLPHLPEGHKCRNLHGHSYRVVVVVEGPLDERGFVTDYAEIDKAIRPIIEEFDHAYLTEDARTDPLAYWLRTNGHKVSAFCKPTTAENMARFLYRCAEDAFLPVCEVRVYETATTCATWRGE